MLNLLTTLPGSLLEHFYPSGWDLARIDACCNHPPETILERQPFWNAQFQPVPCQTLDDFNIMMGHEIALEVAQARDEGRPLILILPV